MTNHTPGPWHLKDVRDDPKKAESWAIYSDVETEDPEIAWDVRKEANARLIAAAPDLLEALKDAYRYASLWHMKAEAAIAKAEGR